MGRLSHFVSFVALRVTAFGRNPIFSETKNGALRLRFLFQGERGIRTLGPVTDSGFRDRPIRPLWHLSEVCTI